MTASICRGHTVSTRADLGMRGKYWPQRTAIVSPLQCAIRTFTLLLGVSSALALRSGGAAGVIAASSLRHAGHRSARQLPSSSHRCGGSHPTVSRPYSSSVRLAMRNRNGKTVAKQHLPSKVCVVCQRPFTWRKKWERNWDEVTTCSKSCNAKRKAQARQSLDDGADSDATDATGSTGALSDSATLDKKARRRQHKEDVKAQKRERRLKRTGNASSDVGRKACDLCHKRVDLLVRCTVDETQQYRMVCGRCWPDVSGGVPDGVRATHPHYRYGGLWKNRHANLRKRVGSGNGGGDGRGGEAATTSGSGSALLEEIESSLRTQDGERGAGGEL